MYTVECILAGESHLIYHPLDPDLQIISPVVDLEIGQSGSFSFSMPMNHPGREYLLPLSSEIYVYNGDEIIFAGRMMGSQEDFYRTGRVNCEGSLSYLIDSLQRPYDSQGSITEFLKKCIDSHNEQVEEKKKFLLGNVTVVDSNDYIHLSSSFISDTMTTFREKLIETHGGYLHVRETGTVRYLDYVTEYGDINSQVLRFGENLLDLSKYIDPTNVITALIPQGAELEDGSIVDITSVNNGRDYIYDQNAVDRYGWIWGTHQWEDVTLPQNLLPKARAYLQEHLELPTTIELSAIDLSIIDTQIESFRLGCRTVVESTPHGIHAEYMLSKKHIDLINPEKSTMTLGQVLPVISETTTKQVRDVSAKIDKTAESLSKEIDRDVDSATRLITGGTGGYVVLDIEDESGERTLPWRILVMDSPDKGKAKSVIQINRNGIGFSTNGINGPYENAWTIDGRLNADFVKTGTMLADRIRGGSLELGGTGLGKDGSIVVMDTGGNKIGSWDKDGLNVLKGIIQGVSAVFGGIDNSSGTIEIRDVSGNVIGRWNNGGIWLRRGDLEVGLLSANEDSVAIGGFESTYGWGRDIFQSADGMCGMSAAASREGKLWFWAGWKSDNVFDFTVDNLGIVRCNEIYLRGDSWWSGWSLTDTLKDVYNRLDALEWATGYMEDDIKWLI